MKALFSELSGRVLRFGAQVGRTSDIWTWPCWPTLGSFFRLGRCISQVCGPLVYRYRRGQTSDPSISPVRRSAALPCTLHSPMVQCLSPVLILLFRSKPNALFYLIHFQHINLDQIYLFLATAKTADIVSRISIQLFPYFSYRPRNSPSSIVRLNAELMSVPKNTNPSMINMLPRTPRSRWLAVAFFLVILYFYHPDFTGTSIDANAEPGFSPRGNDDLTWVKQVLKQNKIGPEIEYAARTIRYVPDAPTRKPMTHVNQNLLPNSFKNITISQYSKFPAGRLLDLHVKQSPRPDQVDASSLIFGVSTTYGRFTAENTSPVKEWERWLTDGHGRSNGASLILALFNTSETELNDASSKLASVGINATVLPSSITLDMPGRYVDLVSMLYNHPDSENKKYFALVDDDTFFPYMGELLRTLSRFNPDKEHYIGTFTERTDWMIGNKAPFAYGGGGIFLTKPVASKIANLPCLELDEQGRYKIGGDQGDRLLYNCLHEYTDVTLTYLPDLHQEDQFGDASGFYESGQQPLSLHHYKSWHQLHPDRTHIVADACGEDCVLQRFQFNDNFIISNGYSIAEYPYGIDFDPLQVEGTFNYGDDTDPEFGEVVFSYSFGQLRKSLNKTGRKRQWELLAAKKDGDARAKQIYLKRRGDSRWRKEGEPGPERDSIVVLTWIP